MTRQTLSVSDVKPLLADAAAVVFDNDGTLVHTMPVHLRAWQAALAEHGLRFPEAQFYHLAGMPAPDIVALLCEQQRVTGVVIDDVLRARQAALGHHLQSVKPVRVVAELLEYAREARIPVAVASGGERHDVLTSLKYAGIDVAAFGAVVTADDVLNGKPHPETFLTAAERLRVDPRKCVGLEDGDKGLEALSAAGMVPIDVRRIRGYPLPECLRQ